MAFERRANSRATPSSGPQRPSRPTPERERSPSGGPVAQLAALHRTLSFGPRLEAAAAPGGVIQMATVASRNLAVKLSPSFEENHLATSENGAKAVSRNRAISDGTLYNTVINSSVDAFKTTIGESEYGDWTAEGNGWKQEFDLDNWYVTCEDTRQDKVVSSVEYDQTGVEVGGYFNENNAEPHVKITHIGYS